MASDRGLNLAVISASAFLVSAVPKTAACRFTTATLVGAGAPVCAGARRLTANKAKQTTRGLRPIRKDMKRLLNLACSALDYHTLFEYPENLVFLQNQVFLAIHFDVRPGILAEQNAVARFDLDRSALARI